MSNSNADQSHFQQYHSSTVNPSLNILPVTESSAKLKVEDALKYIDKVKSRFKEDIYKKFLEVMKDFKAQKINTERVIHNVLTLFNGHQDLIEGFNTFLPPGYQMCNYQIQSTGFGHTNLTSLQTALNANPTSIANPPYTILNTSIKYNDNSVNLNNNVPIESVNFAKDKNDLNNVQHVQSGNASCINLKSIPGISQPPTEFNHAVEYVNKIKNRFQKQPEIYKRFLEVLHWYQKEQRNPDAAKRKKTEAEVSAEVAKLFDNEQDLLEEFSTFLPESTDEMVQNRKTVPANFKPQTYFISASNSAALAGAGNISDRSKYSSYKFENYPDSTPTQMTPTTNQQDKDFITDYCRAATSNITSQSSTTKRSLVQEIPSNTSVDPSGGGGGYSSSERRLSTTPSNATNLPSGHPPPKRIRTSSTNQNTPNITIKETIKHNLLTNNSTDHKSIKFNETINAMIHELRDDVPSKIHEYHSFINALELFNQNLLTIEELKTLIQPLFSKKSDTWLNFLGLVAKVQEKEKLSITNIRNSSYTSFDSRHHLSNVSGFNHNNSDTLYPDRHHTQNHLHHSNVTPFISTNSIMTPKTTTNTTGTSGAPSSASSSVFCRKNIELSKLELCGSHYRILPEELTDKPSLIQTKTPLCKEVLNYHFLCHRSLSAEDAPFVFSKKNHFEEAVFRIEDERYEIDMVMEVNKSAMVKLADIQMRLEEMRDNSSFNFDDSLASSSSILFYKAIQRIYGDKSPEVINGLRTNPAFVVPIILERLREKDAEWKEKIKIFRRNWRDQDHYLLKSLDYQAINFRTRDAANIRPKSLLNSLESKLKLKPYYLNNFQDSTIYAKFIDSLLHLKQVWKKDRPDKMGSFAFSSHLNNPSLQSTTYPPNTPLSQSYPNHTTSTPTPTTQQTIPNYQHNNNSGSVIELTHDQVKSIDYHLLLLFPCDAKYAKSIIDIPFQKKMYQLDHLDWLELLSDASSLVIHHLKRQSNFSKEDKTNMKNLMRQTLQDLFIDERFPMSDDEDNDEDAQSSGNVKENIPTNNMDNDKSEFKKSNDFVHSTNQTVRNKSNSNNHSSYKFILGSRNWYIFIRLYHILVDRLAALKIKGEQILSTHNYEQKQNSQDVADLLLYKKPNLVLPEEYYQEGITLVKDLLDSCEDTANFEDKMREMFGIHAYIWFSMDRLIMGIVKQLQIISCTDSYSRKLTCLFKQCTRSFYGKDEHGNVLNIKHCGTGCNLYQRNSEIMQDEYAYLDAATRYSLQHQEPLIMMLFYRNPPCDNDLGVMSITMFDLPQENDDATATAGCGATNDDDDEEDEDDDDDREEQDDDEDGEEEAGAGGEADDEEEEDDEDDDDNAGITVGADETTDYGNEFCKKSSRNQRIKSDISLPSNKNRRRTVPKHQIKMDQKTFDLQNQNCNLSNNTKKRDKQRSNFEHSWQRYIEKYITCHDGVNSIDNTVNNGNGGITNLDLENRTSVPVFLVRALRRNIMHISRPNTINTKTEKVENKEDDPDDSGTEKKLEIVEDIKQISNKTEKNEPFSDKTCLDQKMSSNNDNLSIQWHDSIVSCVTNIFPGSNRHNLLKYLQSTYMTGHMCPTSDEGKNLMAQYESNKSSWSVGSNSIFYHKTNITDIPNRTKLVSDIRKERFDKFNERWLEKQSKQEDCLSLFQPKLSPITQSSS